MAAASIFVTERNLGFDAAQERRERADGRSYLDEVDELGAESRVSVELIPQGFCRALLNQMDRLRVWVWTERRNVNIRMVGLL